MIETKHTPGPWTYEPGDSMECGGIWAPARMVCDFIEDPNEADARLIAAAPDLLEKAQAAMAACERMTEQYGDVACGVDFLTLGNALRAAIAKATTGV